MGCLKYDYNKWLIILTLIKLSAFLCICGAKYEKIRGSVVEEGMK
jgi:hypothetical protein